MRLFHNAFRQPSVEWNVQPQTQKQLEQFICLMYGHRRESSVDVVGEDHKLTSKFMFVLTLHPCSLL